MSLFCKRPENSATKIVTAVDSEAGQGGINQPLCVHSNFFFLFSVLNNLQKI